MWLAERYQPDATISLRWGLGTRLRSQARSIIVKPSLVPTPRALVGSRLGTRLRKAQLDTNIQKVVLQATPVWLARLEKGACISNRNLRLCDCVRDHFWAHTMLLLRGLIDDRVSHIWMSTLSAHCVVWYYDTSYEFSCTIRSHLTSFNMSTVYLGALRGHPPESIAADCMALRLLNLLAIVRTNVFRSSVLFLFISANLCNYCLPPHQHTGERWLHFSFHKVLMT